MAAPSAPVITQRIGDVGTVRLRWAAVTGAATYNVYRGGVQVQSGLTNPVAVVQCAQGDSLTVTAVNAGAEESVASNAISVGYQGTARSNPPQRPHRPQSPSQDDGDPFS